MSQNLLDALGLLFFLGAWVAYTYFAKVMAKRTHSLSSVLHLLRIDWMSRLLERESRVGDASLIANLERNVTFFASTTILIVAGLLTALINARGAYGVLEALPYNNIQTINDLLIKLSLLLGIFIYAFFTFTWAMRQYGFASVLIGAAPQPYLERVDEARKQQFARKAAKVIDRAGHSYNYGLRAYYFSLAALTWLVSPWFLMVATILVIYVLYRREFLSQTLDALSDSHRAGSRET